MFLKKIYLRDWKAYVDGRFDFPAPTARKNVVLIGAPNGYGKTSFFEAMVLGMFGRYGLPLIARAPLSGAEDSKLTTTYNQFLSGALHRRALDQGRTSCSVELEFDDEDDGPLIVKRTWHFSASGAGTGQHRPQEEELIVYEGPDARPVRVPPSERDGGGNDYLQAYIARKLIPHTLATFFMFDGEQVQALASRDMAAQVRTGIEGLLGIPVLRELAEDLRKYAANRRTGQGAASDDVIKRIERELKALGEEQTELVANLEGLSPEMDALTAKRDQLTRELGSFGSGSVALLRDRQEQMLRFKQERERIWGEFGELLINELPLALVGEPLREKTRKQLQAEEALAQWTAGRTQVESRVDKYMVAVEVEITKVAPPLDLKQKSDVCQRVRDALSALWDPPSQECADSIRHGLLGSAERAQAIGHLQEIGGLSTAELSDLLDQAEEYEKQIRSLDAEIAEVQGIAPHADAKIREIKGIGSRLDELNRTRGALQSRLEAVEAEIASKRQELARYVKSRHDAAPALRRAERADTVAEAIDKIVGDAIPGQVSAVGEAMTEAWRAMAHKTLVKKVDIDNSCDVKLLSVSGRDTRELDLSAGEQQVFAQALISAIATVSGRDFPIIVDTPLGRLDVKHRMGVLKHFLSRSGQVILLSTDTEVVGQYYDAIRTRVSKAYRVDHIDDGEIGISKPTVGYFEEA
ncbi:DNA sulfur modification protein DndD [Burkholderia territorii]|uniref:DNA sulfur modification protein DndD n=1 Tax=Burkholderia territorii TaxID=1503055 RepID=UPI0009BEFE99|nr:DNA sulfur modification protein DndD [Burkholderia territorii]